MPIPRALAISLLATAHAAAAPSRTCLAPPADAVCLSWAVADGNITFHGVWPALPPPSGVGWGAWGISAVSCGSMYPASVWMAIKGPAGVVLEDRFTDAHTVPQCHKRQLSHVTASSVQPDGSFTVSWTRPLAAPPSSGQPSIGPGNVSLIGAAFMGAPLDLRPCEASGIPIHTSVGAFTVQLVAAAATAPRVEEAAPAPPLAAAASAATPGLVAALPVCASGNGAFNNFARVSPRGVEQFFGDAWIPGYLGVTAVDPARRRLYALTPNVAGVAYELASVDVGSGRLLATCSTGIPVPSGGSVEDLGLAWDALNSSLIVAACTDSVCAGYVEVSRLDPSSCRRAPVVKVPTDPAAAVLPGAAAFDPSSNTFVMSITQTVKGSTGLVLIAVDMGAGSVARVFNEARRGVDIVTLSPEAGAPGVFVGLDNSLDPAHPVVSFVRYDAAGNTLTRAPALPCRGALPGSGALDPLGILYFLAPDVAGGGTRVLGVHTANGTLASAGTLPGDAGQTPSAFFFA